MKKSYIYQVFHGELAKEPTVEFKTLKKAIEFIKAQHDAEYWCYDKVTAK